MNKKAEDKHLKRIRGVLQVGIVLLIIVFAHLTYVTIQGKFRQINTQIENLSNLISVEFGITSESLRIIRDNPLFISYLDTGSEEDYKKSAEFFLNILENNERYDQVRYINEDGLEIIRADRLTGKPSLIVTDRLQDKSTRYYFLDTIKLGKDDIFISPLDLNIENGEIEEPLKPTVRGATPVFDSRGNKRGILVINYLASGILNEAASIDEESPYSKLLILNSDGYFLNGLNPETEWGFMYKDRTDETFKKHFPNAWDKILGKTSGFMISRDGVFIFDRLYPIQLAQTSTEKSGRDFSYFYEHLSIKDFHFILVSYSTWKEVLQVLVFKIFIVPLVIFSLAIIVLLINYRLSKTDFQRKFGL